LQAQGFSLKGQIPLKKTKATTGLQQNGTTPENKEFCNIIEIQRTTASQNMEEQD
jgi:hypothetical protein